MKFQLSTIIRTLILMISVLFVLTVLMGNSRNYPVSSADKPEAVSQRGGAEIFDMYCARCHGADGRAQTAKGKRVGATNFTSSKWKPNDARGIKVITNGKGEMPDFHSVLSPEEIKAVWSYVRKFKR
jgi:mono/diheme cytochrome c family protein